MHKIDLEKYSFSDNLNVFIKIQFLHVSHFWESENKMKAAIIFYVCRFIYILDCVTICRLKKKKFKSVFGEYLKRLFLKWQRKGLSR